MNTTALNQTADAHDLSMNPAQLQRIVPFLQQKYVDSGRMPGFHVAAVRKGEVVLSETAGFSDTTTKAPVGHDTLFRIYSMTKPITSVALMMLFEEGKFQLDTPVSTFIPSFAELRVWADGTASDPFTKFPEREMTIRDLLTHTAGLSYGFMNRHPVDEIYRRDELGTPNRRNVGTGCHTTEEFADRLSHAPLLFSPGTQWSYSVATDVVGRLVEVMSGMSLDEFFRTRIFEPLQMADTVFDLRADHGDRLAGLYMPDKHGALQTLDPSGHASAWSVPTKFYSGGGGLVSSANDYHRFTQMLLNKGELDGVRLIGRKTVEYMTSNHLPSGGDLPTMGMKSWDGTHYDGIGFGLGFAVTIDPLRAQRISSAGNYYWSGAASTVFWVDPVEELVVMFFTQVIPAMNDDVRSDLQALVYGSLIN
jgi:CubicO group peptidase (beta-lactamase class C family)